jgi:hypothetical protein
LNLVESIKALRKKSSDINIEKADWDYYPGNHPGDLMPSVTDVSQFLDTKLISYCSDKKFLFGPLTPRILSQTPGEVSVVRNNNQLINAELKHTVIRIPTKYEESVHGKSAFIASYDIYVVPVKDTNFYSLSLKARIAITSDPNASLGGTDWLNEISTKDAILESIRSNLTIIAKDRARPIKVESNDPEHAALETLREMIPEAEFRQYLKYGFISVKGKKGRIYQIFRNRSHTKVFEDGCLKEEICVRLPNYVPGTDNVIAFKIMIETSEELFRSSGNVYKNLNL